VLALSFPLLTPPTSPSVQTQKDVKEAIQDEIDFYKDIKPVPTPETNSVSEIQKQSAQKEEKKETIAVKQADPALSKAKEQIIAAREVMKKEAVQKDHQEAEAKAKETKDRIQKELAAKEV
jgi:hypothetical protein